MKKILFLVSYLLTSITLISILLDSFFYLGFTQKHFLINLPNLILFYLIFVSVLAISKVKIFPKKILKINRFFLPIIAILSVTLIYLEETNYPNFIFSHIHLNPNISFYLPIISFIIFIFFDFKPTRNKVPLLITPLLSIYLGRFIAIGKFFEFKLLDFNSLVYNLPNFRTILINYLLWLNVLLFFIFIFKKRYQSLFAHLIFIIIFSLINHYKNNMLQTYFMVSDISLVKELLRFIPSIVATSMVKKELLMIAVALIFTFFLFKKLFNQKNPPIKKKIFIIIFPIIFVTFPIVFPSQYTQLIKSAKIETFIPNPIDNCYINGFLFCFYNDFKNINIPAPNGYNQDKIKQISDSLNPTTKEKTNEIKPNIIIILSEAFWDPTALPEIKYSSDPIPNIRTDIKSTFISPSFGGGTANVEFELLTGLSNYFLNGASPYSQAIKKPIPSIFTLFKEQGFFTTVIHPFYSSMYNRKPVYKDFGLDNFITIENMNQPQYAGPYVSDTYFYQQIINQLNSSTNPQLIFGISMQNHVVFKPNRYTEHPISITSNLDKNDQDILQSYVDGLNLTDKSYSWFRDEINKIKKPVIIISFGDHLTSLGSGTDIYQKSGFDVANNIKMHSTPLSAWSNFNQKFNFPSQISPNFLPLEILKLSNIQPKYQFAYLNKLYQDGSILNKNITNNFTVEELNDYNLIQYDLLFGKQYMLK